MLEGAVFDKIFLISTLIYQFIALAACRPSLKVYAVLTEGLGDFLVSLKAFSEHEPNTLDYKTHIPHGFTFTEHLYIK